MVSAQRLLKVATALSDGATKLHAQLRHLEPAERDAILDLVAEQVTEIVTLWADLVRGVVSDRRRAPADLHARPRRRDPEPRGHDAVRRRSDKSGARGDHPARVPTSDARRHRAAGRPPSPCGPSPSPSARPAPRRRRRRRCAIVPHRDRARLGPPHPRRAHRRPQPPGGLRRARTRDRPVPAQRRAVRPRLPERRQDEGRQRHPGLARRGRDPAQGHRRPAGHVAVLRRDRPARRRRVPLLPARARTWRRPSCASRSSP